MFTLIQKLPAVQNLGAGSLLGVLQAAVGAGSAESVRYLAALPSAAAIGAVEVEGLLKRAVALKTGNRDLCLGFELCKLPGAHNIGPAGLVLLLEKAVPRLAVQALDVESMVLLPAAAEISSRLVACLVEDAEAAGQAGKARALKALLSHAGG